jgi:hypothetical protein
MRGILITAGLLVMLSSAFVERTELGAVPGFIYMSGHLALIAGLLGKRFTLKRMAVAIVVLAFALRITFSGLSSLRHRVYTIRPGMSVEEVRRHMAGFQEGLNPAGPYTIGDEPISDGSVSFRDPSASPSHNAFGVVVIERGRVRAVQFMPD